MHLRELFDQSASNDVRSDLMDLLTMAKSNNLLQIDLNTLARQMKLMGYPFDKSGLKQILEKIQMVKKCDNNFVYLIGYQDSDVAYDKNEVDQKVGQLAQKVANKTIK